MSFHDLFLCQKYNFGRTFGHFNSNCIINANGKGVKSCVYLELLIINNYLLLIFINNN